MPVVTITVREANCHQNLPPPGEIIPQITTTTSTSNLLDFKNKKIKKEPITCWTVDNCSLRLDRASYNCSMD